MITPTTPPIIPAIRPIFEAEEEFSSSLYMLGSYLFIILSIASWFYGINWSSGIVLFLFSIVVFYYGEGFIV